MADPTRQAIQRQSRIRLLDKCKAYQWAIREFGPRLKPPETLILLSIVDRSLGRTRTRVNVTLRAIATGCNVGTRTVTRANARLVAVGAIDIIATGRGFSYHPNIGAKMDDLNPDMKIPKRRRNPTKVPFGRGGEGSQIGESDSPDWLGPISKQESKEKTTSRESNTLPGTASGGMRPPATPIENVQAAAEKASKKDPPEGGTSAHRNGRTSSNLWESWKNAHKDRGVDCPLSWKTGKNADRWGVHWAKQLADVWPADGKLDALDKRGEKKRDPKNTKELHDFLDWCVSRWDEIMASDAFNWMDRNKRQPVPNIRFIYTNHERFYGMWKGRAMEDWRTGPHAEEIEDLLIAGKRKEAEDLMRSTSK